MKRFFAAVFLGILALLGGLYLFTQHNAGGMPFFYTTR